MGDEQYDLIHSNKLAENPVINEDGKIYPQGAFNRLQLRDSFIKEAPFYLKKNEQAFCRTKPENSKYYDSAAEEARYRFESGLKTQTDFNMKIHKQ